MNSHDVSKDPTFLEHLQRHKENLEVAQGVKGLSARPSMSNGQTLFAFMQQQLVNALADCHWDGKSFKTTFLPPAYPPCIHHIDKLQRIMIKGLSLETHHRGRYLVARTITMTERTTAVRAIVEDEDGDMILLQIYNQEMELGDAQSLRMGTLLIIKEPFVEVTTDGEYGIRVDHISDVSFILDFPGLVHLKRTRYAAQAANASSWKTRGSEHFTKGEFRSAIQCYSKTLEYQPSPELRQIALLNRALCFLKSDCFDSALLDVENVLQTSVLSEKGLFRKAQALYHLQRFEESCETHGIIARNYPDNTMAAREYTRASARLAEQKSGKYNFKRMILEAKKRHPPTLDRGTYIGPVAIKKTQSHGRGLFTTAAVKAGDLLSCEKAFSHAFRDDDDNDPNNLRLLLNADTDKATIGTQVVLIELIAQKLFKNPSLLPAFVDLHHGTYESVNVLEVDNVPVVDSVLVERIIALNSFGCPLLSRETHMGGAEMEYEIDHDRLDYEFHSCGVWTMASYINHSCMSNARRAFIGDMMIVRASRDLPADTEITFWYESPMPCVPRNLPMNLQHWDFICDCMLCQDIDSTSKSVLAARERLSSQIPKLIKKNRSNLQLVEAAVSRIADTFPQPAHEIPRLCLYPLYFSLATIHASFNNSEKAIRFGLMTLESLGFVIEGGNVPHVSDTPLSVQKWGLMTDEVVRCWMVLCCAYQELAPELASQAEGYARISYRICVGEDESFEQTYSSTLSDRVDGLLMNAE